MLDDTVSEISQEELDAEARVRIEFQNLTNNQAYEHVLRYRVMALKHGVTILQSVSDIFGTDSRELLIPSLNETLHSVMNNTSATDEFHMLDVGAGSGETIDWFFAKKLEENIGKKKNIIHIIEPTPALLKAYQQKLLEYEHLNKGIVYQGPVQDYYTYHKNTLALPKMPGSIDFINCMQMIYHLTDITKPSFDPRKDIIDFITFLYGLLRPGGEIYIAFLDMELGLSSIYFKFYEQIIKDMNVPQKHFQVIKAQNELLSEGKILEILESQIMDENTRPKFFSTKMSSGFFARSLGDLAALSLFGGDVLKPDDKIFDFRRLDFAINELKAAAITPVAIGERKPYGLTRCIRAEENVWKIDHSLIISVISKERVI
ncbi:methyltransferase domain-containing protein [Gigaspora margarita]|uniref:Methyltransferase domain-containing protein n=1 Tax=Gigaspora margarita TaxID=4874 RepID=A0A8H4B332_GIGMA|nr:methyltransferase domain-containing protein [Gigaspora margarita]